MGVPPQPQTTQETPSLQPRRYVLTLDLSVPKGPTTPSYPRSVPKK